MTREGEREKERTLEIYKPITAAVTFGPFVRRKLLQKELNVFSPTIMSNNVIGSIIRRHCSFFLVPFSNVILQITLLIFFKIYLVICTFFPPPFFFLSLFYFLSFTFENARAQTHVIANRPCRV